MFRGQFEHSIDAKGRVSVPARMRAELLPGEAATFIMTPAPFEPCLHVYPLATWEELEKKIAEAPVLDSTAVRFRRMYVSAAIDCELDGAGRVLIPPHLRERARFARDVVWAGMGRMIELWSKDSWAAALAMTPEQSEDFRRAAEELIRI